MVWYWFKKNGQTTVNQTLAKEDNKLIFQTPKTKKECEQLPSSSKTIKVLKIGTIIVQKDFF